MFKTLTILSVALLLTLTASVSAEEDRNLLSKLNSNVELTKVNNKPVASVSGEPLKTAETRPGATGSDFTSSHTEQSYSSSASFESSGAGGPVSSSASGELNVNRGSAPVNPQAASSTSYQVSGENFAGASSEAQQHQQNQQLQAQPQQHGSGEVYSSSAEDISSGAAAPSSAPSGYGRPDLNEVDFNRNNGYHAHGARALSHPYGSYDISGQTYDLQRNPEPAYDNGASGEFNSAQANVANEGGYGLNQDTSAYEDANSNEDEGSAYRTQEPEGSPVALAGSGPENHQQQQVQQLQHQQNQQNLHHQQQQQQQQQQVQVQQQQSVPSAEQGAQGPRKASTLATPGPVPDYGGFRPVIKSQTIPTPPIPGPQRPQHALAQGEPFRSVSINYEPPKSVYSYDGSPNTANTGSYNAKSFPVYGHGQQEPQRQVATPPNTHAGYNLDYASGKPYGGDLSIKPYSSDPNGNVKKIIPMTIGYDELVKPPTPSAAQYHTAGSPPSSPHHGSGYMVSHGPPQQNYEQGPPQGPYGQPPQGPPQGQQGPPQFNGGYGQPVTYQATPIGYAQPDSYEQQSGPIGYDQPPQQNAPHHHQQQHQQQQPQPQQGPPMGSPINYGQQTPPVSYEQAEQIQVQPQQPQQGPPQNSPHPQPPHHSHPYPPPSQVSGQLSPPPQQQLQQTPPGYGPHSGPGPVLSGPPQFETEQNYGPPQSAAPVNYEQSGPNEFQASPPKQNYEQTTTFVESSGYPGNLGPSYGTIKDGPSPLTASMSGPAPAPIEGYSGNIAPENEYYPSSYDSIENSAGPSSYPSPMSGFNSQGGSYSSGGYSLPDDSYMQSLFGFPTYDVSGGKGNPYAAGSNPIPSPASAGSHLSGVPSLGSSGLSGSSSGKPSPSSFLPSIKFTGNGIKLTGFGSSLTGGLGSLNQAIASTLGSGLSGVTGPGLGLSSGLTQALSSGLGSGLGSSLGSGPSMNGAALHGNGPSSGGLGRPLASFYNNLSGLGSPFGGLGGLNNYGTAASKLIPQAIRAPFRTMYRALMGNGAPNPMNG